MISSGSRQNCKVTSQPSLNIKGKQRSPISDAIINAMKNVSIPVKLLHVTQMGAFRSDAHVGSWNDNPTVPDCSHWCLPGVPDMWNELLFSFLLSQWRNPDLFWPVSFFFLLHIMCVSVCAQACVFERL